MKGTDHVVWGVVYEPCNAGEVCKTDTQGDFIRPDELRSVARDYLANERGIGTHHEKELRPSEATPVESFIAPVDMVVDGEHIKKGSWVLFTELNDALWKRVQSGELGAYSIDGTGVRVNA